MIDSITNTVYKDNIYYGYHGSTLVVAAKQNETLLACAVCIRYSNPHYALVPEFYVPKNMYSWIKDNGKTTADIIKSIINLSGIPVLSDIEMTEFAKKSFKKKIDNHDIKAKIFNICNGDISQYDPDIWETDDDCRVLFMEHNMGKPISDIPLSEWLINEGTYNYSQIGCHRKHYG
jgi:hypothetical protein